MRANRALFAVMLAGFAVVAAGLVAWRALASRPAVDRLGPVKEQIRRRFPAAPQMSTAALEGLLRSEDPVVLLDVRRPEEFAVSHLAGARRVDPDDPSPQLPPEAYEDGTTVVAYCSVGWRSSRLVESLRADGVDAHNLEGSAFQWVAEGRPLVRNGHTVHVVHPYGRAWAWLVDPEHRGPFDP